MAKTSRAEAVAKAAQELQTSESSIYRYMKQEGSLEAAIAVIKYNKIVGSKKNCKTAITTGIRYPFLMNPLWRIALGMPPMDLDQAIG